MSDAACDKTLNIIDGSNTKKYIYCEGNMIYKDNKFYSAGDIVELKTIESRYFHLGEYDFDTGVPKHCSVDSNDSSILNCDSNVKEYFHDLIAYDYSKKNSNKYNYSCFETDKDVMNFSKINEDKWNDYGYLELEVPVSFSMPDHNVLFKYIPPR